MTIPSPKTCRICSKPLSLHEQYSGQICSHWRCRWRHLEDQLRAHRQEAAQALGEAEADSFPITVVPRRTFRSVPLAPERRQEFAAFLADLVGEMADVGDPADAAPSVLAELEAATAPRDAAPVSALLAQVCAVCGGFCCYYGGTRHAFLDRENLQRASQEQPETVAPDIAARYLAQLPPMHYEGSCVYHTESGCALPRRMRARICNAYECRGLKDGRQNSGTASSARAFVVVRHDHRIIRSAFVDAGRIRHFSGTEVASGTDAD